MSERDEFEAWFEREYPVDASGGRTKYRQTSVIDLMFSAYQAARAPQGVPALTDWQPESDFHAMMAVHSLCPDGLSHPAKMRWMAAEFRKRTAAPQPFPEKPAGQKLPRGGGQSFKSVNDAHEKAAYPKYQD